MTVTTTPVLSVRDLSVSFRGARGRVVQAVDAVSFDVDPGETLAIVGESGSGKSVTALSILRLVPQPPGHLDGGSIHFKGEDLLALDDAGIRAIRGNRIAMIFQEPMSSLNPVLTVGMQVGEPIREHRGTPWRETASEVVSLLTRVAIPDAAEPTRVLSAPVLGRHAPARHDRDVAGDGARAHRRRRAHHRARRHRAGADPGAAQASHPRDRRGAHPHHPRSRGGGALRRPRRRHVRRAGSSRARRRASSTRGRAIPTPAACSTRCRASTPTAAVAWCRSRASRPISPTCRRAARSRRAARG